MYNIENLDKIKNYLTGHQQTVAVAESVTSGHIQAAFSLAENALQFFQGGITTYNLGQKCRHLGVEPVHAMSCNSVSDKIAGIMALNVSKMFLSDWGIGITGYAAPFSAYSVDHPFAYYSFFFRNEEKEFGKLTTGTESSFEVQHFYTEEIIKRFVRLLYHP